MKTELKPVNIGDLVQWNVGPLSFEKNTKDRRLGIVITDVFVGGYGADVVKVLTTHFHSGEEIYATWQVMNFEVLA